MPRTPPATERPEGLVYRPEIVTPEEERELLAGLDALELHEVRMRGRVARRTVRHFDLDYDYRSHGVTPSEPLPAFLEPLRGRCARLAGLPAEALRQTLVTRYPPGAPIGWHHDAPAFGAVIGASLLAAARMRFQRARGGERRVFEVLLEPRSGYVLDGSARTEWQHSIPPVRELRWSVTFRTLRHPERVTG